MKFEINENNDIIILEEIELDTYDNFKYDADKTDHENIHNLFFHVYEKDSKFTNIWNNLINSGMLIDNNISRIIFTISYFEKI